jgi:hypothetical protein
MPAIALEPVLHEAERRAVLMVLRSHPEWTLEHLADLLSHSGPRTSLLRALTLGELLTDPRIDTLVMEADGGPPIDPKLLETAKRLTGAEFDECVRGVIVQAHGQFVGAAYLRARVGGPRWKLQWSLRRLVQAGVVERRGTTSSTRYRSPDPHRQTSQ